MANKVGKIVFRAAAFGAIAFMIVSSQTDWFDSTPDPLAALDEVSEPSPSGEVSLLGDNVPPKAETVADIPATKPKVAKENPTKPKTVAVSDEERRLKVAPDYQYLADYVRFSEMALQKQEANTWANIRLSVIAQRERANFEEAAAREAEAKFKRLKLENNSKRYETAEGYIANNEGVEIDLSTMPSIQLVSMNSKYADVEIDGSIARVTLNGNYKDFGLLRLNNQDYCALFMYKGAEQIQLCM